MSLPMTVPAARLPVPAAPQLPAVATSGSLTRYLAEIRRFPMLEPEEEFMLAKSWRDHGDVAAAHRLVTSHLRLVAKVALSFRGYGLPLGELIAEGNIGLMQAVKKFEPDKGFRLATYAIWWIRASIQEFILRSWSLVKMGTSASRKRLFFNLKRLKRQLQEVEQGSGTLRPEHIRSISATLGVSEADVVDMDQRMGAVDPSLNAPVGMEGEDTWMDFLADPEASQEARLAEHQEQQQRHQQLTTAMESLNVRERHILSERRLKDEPTTLEILSQQYGISRERVRQIEMRAMEKLQKFLLPPASAASAASTPAA